MVRKVVESKLFILQGIMFVFLLLRDVNILILPDFFYLTTAMIIPFLLQDKEVIAFSAGFAMMGTGIQVVYVTFACLLAYVYKKSFSLKKDQLKYSLIIIAYEAAHLIFFVNDSIVEFVRYAVLYMYVFAMIFEEYDCEESATIAKTYISATVFVCIDVLLQTLTLLDVSFLDFLNMSFRLGYSDQLGQNIRFSADPNLLGQSCTISLVMCVVLIKKNYGNAFLRIATVLLCLFGLMTLSKTFLISMVLVVFCIVLSTSQHKNILKNLKNVCIAGFVAILGLLVIYKLYPSYISNITERFVSNDLTTGRINNAQGYFEFFLREPIALLFGFGLQDIGAKSLCIASPHAAFIELLASFGVCGTIIIIFTLVKAIKMISSKKNVLLPYMPLIVTFILIQSTQFFRLRDRMLVLIVVVALCGISYKNVSKEKKDEKENFNGC